METRFEGYLDLSQLGNQTLDKIIDHEREVFGYRGYGEYAFCTDPTCRRIQSIDEIYGVSDTKKNFKSLKELEANGCIVPDCPDCGSPSQLIFDPDVFRPYLVSLYRNGYGAVLFDENDDVQGTCVAQKTTLEKYFYGIMDYKESMNWNDFRLQLEKILKLEVAPDMEVISTNRVSVSRPFRKKGMFNKLSSFASNQRPEYDSLPAFASVRYDGNILPILQGVGYKEVTSDPYGTVAVAIKEYGILRNALNLDPSDFMRQYLPNIRNATVQARSHKSEIPQIKYYKGVSVLNELQERKNQLNASAEFLDSPEITPDVLDEMTDVFRTLYNNEYGQYIFYPSEGRPISPAEVFESEKFVDLETMDSFDLSDYQHPKTGEVPLLWHNPTIVRQRLDHLKNDGQLVTIRHPVTSDIQALTYGYTSTVEEAFKNEEWENPNNYSGYRAPERLRDVDNFIGCINRVRNQPSDLYAHTPVYIWNQLGIMPKARRTGKMGQLTRCFFEELKKKEGLPEIGLAEVQIDSMIHNAVRNIGAIDVPGALSNHNSDSNQITLIVFCLQDFIRHFADN
jgi:hypothetical protein